MDDRQLAAFVAVAEELSFTRAAARLYVVQSTLSATVRALEQDLGAPLFTRSTRRVALTAVGEALLPSARAAIDSVDRMRSLAAEDAAGLRGRVRVGTFSALDILDLPGVLGAFRRRHRWWTCSCAPRRADRPGWRRTCAAAGSMWHCSRCRSPSWTISP